MQSLGTKSLLIVTFGCREEQHTDCAMVRVGIAIEEWVTPIELKLLSVPYINFVNTYLINTTVALTKVQKQNFTQANTCIIAFIIIDIIIKSILDFPGRFLIGL